jgi:sugar lactone lactonase YvrE
MELLCDTRDRIGESPLWSVAEQALWWVDIEGRWLHRFDWALRAPGHWQLPERVGSIALHARGGLVVALESRIVHVRTDGEELAIVDTLAPAPWAGRRDDMRFNDGRCDRDGRFWVTGMVRDVALGDASGALYRLDERGLSPPLVDGLVTGNGLAFDAAGRTLYLSDSHPRVRRVWAFDLDAGGLPLRRREFVDMHRHAGRPDGAAVDAEGGYWTCANDAGLVHRFTPDGRLDRSIEVPVRKPAMCAFGGPDLDLMFITSIRPDDGSGGDPELAGAVFVTRPGVAGLPETPFAAGAVQPTSDR